MHNEQKLVSPKASESHGHGAIIADHLAHLEGHQRVHLAGVTHRVQ